MGTQTQTGCSSWEEGREGKQTAGFKSVIGTPWGRGGGGWSAQPEVTGPGAGRSAQLLECPDL